MEKEFIELINRHRGIIYKVCNLYFQKSEDKKDLFQEIVFQLWKSFPGFRNESKKSTWMYRVALNTVITNFRKESKKPERRSLSTSELEIPEIQERPVESDNQNILKTAIDELTKIEKAIIMLYLEEKSYAEISEIMGISHSNVGVKLNRVKIKLEKIVKTK